VRPKAERKSCLVVATSFSRRAKREFVFSIFINRRECSRLRSPSRVHPVRCFMEIRCLRFRHNSWILDPTMFCIQRSIRRGALAGSAAGKVVFIAGASQGVGRATAAAFARAGAKRDLPDIQVTSRTDHDKGPRYRAKPDYSLQVQALRCDR